MSASPFDNSHANPWTSDFVDFPQLNAHASDAIAAAIQRVRDSAKRERADIGTASILVLGPAGAGKTHLFLRLRRKLGPRAVFVHLRPLIGTQMTPRYVLGEIVRQLDYEGTSSGGSFRQLEAVVGATLAYLRFEPVTMPRIQLERLHSLDDRARAGEVAWAVEQLVQRHPEMDETYAQRLLEVPVATSIAHRRACLAWLAGRDLEQAQMQRLGVTSSLSEERVIPALQTLGLLATPGAPIVLVFDQLENLMDGQGEGGRVRDYANLVAELFDTMRGVVIVQMALDTEWDRAIAPQLSETQKTRLAGHLETLSLPTPSQRRELVRAWAEQIPGPHEPFPAPFGEKRLAGWCTTHGMTPRMLMVECKKAILEGADDQDAAMPGFDSLGLRSSSLSDGDATFGEDAIAAAWGEHLAAARTTLDESSRERRGADPARLVGGMGCAFRFVPGAKVVTLDARKPIQLRLQLASRDFAFALLHQSHPKAVGAALEKARASAEGATLVVLRELAIELPPTWRQTRARVVDLVRSGGGRFEAMEREDAARLLALESFLSAARSFDVEDATGRALTPEAVESWVRTSLEIASWPIVRALDDDAGRRREREQEAVPDERPADLTSATASVEACLAQLHIASIDRLVREVARVKPDTTRAQVLSAVEAMGTRVRWFGRSIIARRDESP